MTLIQTEKLVNFPVVLVGKDYWQGFYDWVVEKMLEEGTISKEDTKLFTLAETKEEAIKIVTASQLENN